MEREQIVLTTSKKNAKHTVAGIPTWSPTVVLICRSTAYVWQSGRDAQFSADCGPQEKALGSIPTSSHHPCIGENVGFSSLDLLRSVLAEGALPRYEIVLWNLSFTCSGSISQSMPPLITAHVIESHPSFNIKASSKTS
ncbi:hypothetical protein KCU62_g1416, partial [Aureobasidium sp. EXF-3399]